MTCKNDCARCQARSLCIAASAKRAEVWQHIVLDLNLPHYHTYMDDKCSFPGTFYVDSDFRIWTIDNVPVAWSEAFL